MKYEEASERGNGLSALKNLLHKFESSITMYYAAI